MSDNLGPLRQAMSDLAEHGGATDMYERSLRRSRQVRRRNRIATGAATAAAVFAVAGAVPFMTGHGSHPSTPAATGTPAPYLTPTSAAPSGTPTSPAPSTTGTSARSSTKKPPSPPASNRPRYPDCPSAKTLERIARDAPEDEALPKDWHFPASSVVCWRTWATADPAGPEPGDGVYLFHYKPGTGWRYHSQGSAYLCADLGITSGNPPFCAWN